MCHICDRSHILETEALLRDHAETDLNMTLRLIDHDKLDSPDAATAVPGNEFSAMT